MIKWEKGNTKVHIQIIDINKQDIIAQNTENLKILREYYKKHVPEFKNFNEMNDFRKTHK